LLKIRRPTPFSTDESILLSSSMTAVSCMMIRLMDVVRLSQMLDWMMTFL